MRFQVKNELPVNAVITSIDVNLYAWITCDNPLIHQNYTTTFNRGSVQLNNFTLFPVVASLTPGLCWANWTCLFCMDPLFTQHRNPAIDYNFGSTDTNNFTVSVTSGLLIINSVLLNYHFTLNPIHSSSHSNHFVLFTWPLNKYVVVFCIILLVLFLAFFLGLLSFYFLYCSQKRKKDLYQRLLASHLPKKRYNSGSASPSSFTTLASIPGANIRLTFLECEIDYQELEILQPPIGRGAYGIVHKAVYQGTVVAVKSFLTIGQSIQSLDQEQQKRLAINFLKEMGVLSSLRHPNIVLLIGGGIHTSNKYQEYFMVTEFINRGSLFDVIRKFRKQKKKFSLKAVIRILIGVARGMAYLHGKGVIHRDLKSGNILLDKNWNAKIADFGISRIEEEMEIEGTGATGGGVTPKDIMTQIGTPRWMAPEIIDREGRYTEKVDIYSFAMVMYEMITGRVPFEEERYDYILHGEIAGGRRPVVEWNKGRIIIDLEEGKYELTSSKEMSFGELPGSPLVEGGSNPSSMEGPGSGGSGLLGSSSESVDSGGSVEGIRMEKRKDKEVESEIKRIENSKVTEEVKKLEELMKVCWNADPDNRLTFLEIVNYLVAIEEEHKKLFKHTDTKNNL